MKATTVEAGWHRAGRTAQLLRDLRGGEHLPIASRRPSFLLQRLVLALAGENLRAVIDQQVVCVLDRDSSVSGS
jgi:hypothetical protein